MPALLAVYDRAPVADLSGLLNPSATARDGILIVAPHPDDESLGCGGLIASAVAAGIAIEIAMLTDGDASHPNSKEYPPEKLAALRRHETVNALSHLGVDAARITFCHLKDGGVPSNGSIFDATVETLAALCRRRRLSSLFCTSKLDPHPDHKAAFAIASAVCDQLANATLLSYPIWSWMLDDIAEADTLRGYRLDISRHVAIKERAIGAHVSQVSGLIQDDPEGFRLKSAFISRFLEPYEMFISR